MRSLTSIWGFGTFFKVPQACAKLASSRAGMTWQVEMAVSTEILIRPAC